MPRALLAAFVTGLALAGCSTRGAPYEGYEPPPHVPALGYRTDHRHAWESSLEVYVVTGLADTWYGHGWYFRVSADGWERAVFLEGPWERTSPTRVPPTLRDLGPSGRLVAAPSGREEH